VSVPYHVDKSASRLLLHVKKTEAFGCGALHAHVVEAEQHALTSRSPSTTSRRRASP
jgi:hypothetical protein